MIHSPLGWVAVASIAAVSTFVWLSSCTPFYTDAHIGSVLLSHPNINPKLGRRPKSAAQSDFQLSAINQTFPAFLSKYDKTDLVWLTLADVFFSKTCTPHLQQFVRDLQPYQAPEGPRQHRLVTLCIDPGCMETCKEKGWTCYGEYEATRPDIIMPATWPKLAGLIDTMETGRDVIFVDSDVFFRADPLQRLAPLGSFDLQIQDETVDGNVNTGFFHMMSTPEAIAHWKGVLAMDMEQVSRDQHNTNILLGTQELRQKEWDDHMQGPQFKQEFTSKNGLSVRVVEPSTVFAHHFSFSWPRLDFINAAAWHGTCLESRAQKFLIPREYGFWQDVDGYYSQPPKAIRLPALAGTPEQVARLFGQFAAVAIATNRSMIPPATATITLEDGSSVTRGLFSTFPMDDLIFEQQLPILEADYVAHAIPHLVSPADLVDLTQTNQLSVRAFGELDTLVARLSNPDILDKRIISLIDWAPETFAGEVPENLQIKDTCQHLDLQPGCDQMCRKA